ncbi:MAG: acetate/propionate family kinase [Pontibacterium sp.]
MNTVLTVNGGSSSLKCALFAQNAIGLQCRYIFKLSNILKDASLKVSDATGKVLATQALNFSEVAREGRHQAALQVVMNWLAEQAPDSHPVAIGHRVVHGGEVFSAPTLVTDEILTALEDFIPLAPLHQPYNLKLIRACQAIAADLPQVACFDTMFHAGQPLEERNYALPQKYTDAGIHRYGFHGLSYEFIHRHLTTMAFGELKTVICHLGAGASMCAVKAGRSIASSMGFTAVEGLPMGSRCGNIDPGVLLYLQRHDEMSLEAVETLINKQSGLLGVSGISSDMQELHRSDDPRAEEAINMFAYRISLELGRLSAALQGLEQVVFTGGIGENDADLRRRVLERSAWLGIRFDENANQQNESLISTAESTVKVHVIATDEEAMIAMYVGEVQSNL